MDFNLIHGSDGDKTDAGGLFRILKRKPNPDDVLPERVDFEEYGMAKRGKCYIFNNKEFLPHTGVDVRNGTDADAARLSSRFKRLGFDTRIFNDWTVRQINDKLEEAGKEDYWDSSCFVCCVLTHGKDGFLYASDGKYPAENLFAPFRGDVCPSLVGKPKMFFIQACEDDNSGVPCKEGLDADIQFKIPTHADFLAVYSSVPDKDGSLFIQALCEAIDEHAKNKDILSILTVVNRKVAFDYNSCTPHDSSMDRKEQVPLVTSTLTRNIRFSFFKD